MAELLSSRKNATCTLKKRKLNKTRKKDKRFVLIAVFSL
jgi:hypothetical protein